MILKEFENELFIVEHLTESDDLSKFCCSKGKGLDNYLKYMALSEEKSNVSRTYIVKTKDTLEMVAYFTLRTGLITVSRGLLKGFDAITGIELANFAVNDSYREANDQIPKLGSYIFLSFILPLTKKIQEYIGAEYLYIYALPYDKLMAHYRTMGFQRTSEKMERFVYRHVKPNYDKNCIFMYQKL